MQTEIQKQQKSLSESSHEAILRVDDYKLVSEKDLEDFRRQAGLSDEDAVNMGGLIIHLSNFGKGAADDLRTRITFHGEELFLEVDTLLTYGSHLDPLAFTGEGGVLGPGEKEVSFTSGFSVSKSTLTGDWDLQGDEPDVLSPTEIMWLMQDAGERKVEVSMDIRYQDGVGEGEPKTLFRKNIDLRKCRDFSSIEHTGEPIFD